MNFILWFFKRRFLKRRSISKCFIFCTTSFSHYRSHNLINSHSTW
ncbi:429R [Invertebrate iridescent virus 6]|uniref:429R n=1 Tax=Invertebrate iridescent virus 6 TaxID=176652 RepID=Q91F96_IIV6|nr:429R [Invertebrate iridescent virus 6]AAK82289.1 429R [Invertebrate iridescent virus 6]QMS79367.1 hypothetical protein IIV6-T1_421 [Invertebrate iridescent virus 6]